jgi:hypothetical protein
MFYFGRLVHRTCGYHSSLSGVRFGISSSSDFVIIKKSTEIVGVLLRWCRETAGTPEEG